MSHPIAVLLLCVSALTLSACGQMGPLYMPAEEPPVAADTQGKEPSAPASAAE